jgi:hypothetical protein
MNPLKAKQLAVLSAFSKATLQDEEEFSGAGLLSKSALVLNFERKLPILKGRGGG